MNRSNSVDTDNFMRHLQGKSKNYDVLRGLGEEPSNLHLNKLERQMYVMDFMENARTKNPFREMKLKGLIEKRGSTADIRSKQELRKML